MDTTGALISTGGSLLSGMLGGGGEGGGVPGDIMTQFRLGNLTPELEALLEEQYGISGQAVRDLMASAQGAPSYGDISGMYGGLEGIIGQLQSGELNPAVQKAYDEATQGSYQLNREMLQRELGLTEDYARDYAAQAQSDIASQMAMAGIGGGSTVGAERLGRVSSDVNRSLQAVLSGNANALGGLAQANLGTRASGLLQAQGLSQQGLLGAGQMKLNSLGQMIGMRQSADANLNALMSNPVMASLMNRKMATGQQYTQNRGVSQLGFTGDVEPGNATW